MDKNMEKNIGTSLRPGHGARPNNHNKHHYSHQQQQKKAKKRPLPEAARKKRTGPTATSARLGDLRLILESTATDEELAQKAKNAADELQVVVEALGDEGPSYLGIVDKGELEKRKLLLERRCKLLKEERELLQTVRIQLKEEEQGTAGRVEPRAPSSPPPRHNGGGGRNDAAAAEPSLSARMTSSAAAGAATSPPVSKRPYGFPLSPPAVARSSSDSIGDFLRKNSAAVGKKLDAAARSGGGSDKYGDTM